MQYLHQVEGLSTYQIADILKAKPDTIRHSLWSRGMIKRSLGKDIEEKVALWLEDKGNIVIRQKGDAPFDLLVNDKKVDVKSAHRSTDRKYSFQLQCGKNRKELKDLGKHVDWFYLTFLDEARVPVYKIQAFLLEAKQTLHVSGPACKYPLVFVGYLES